MRGSWISTERPNQRFWNSATANAGVQRRIWIALLAAVMVSSASACASQYRQPSQPRAYALLYPTPQTPAPLPQATVELGPTPAPSVEPTAAATAPPVPPAIPVVAATALPVRTVSVEVPPSATDTPAPAAGIRGQGFVPLDGRVCPSAHPVKLAANGLVYSYRSPIYARVTPVACFTTVAAANGEPASGR